MLESITTPIKNTLAHITSTPVLVCAAIGVVALGALSGGAVIPTLIGLAGGGVAGSIYANNNESNAVEAVETLGMQQPGGAQQPMQGDVGSFFPPHMQPGHVPLPPITPSTPSPPSQNGGRGR